MGKVKFKWNSAGFTAILKHPAVLAKLKSIGDRKAANAGDGFVADPYIGRNRARVTVRAETREARKAEAENKVLTRAMGS